MDKLMQVREAGALAQHPKLVATYQWLQTVKGMAVQGLGVSAVAFFPPAPFRFEAVMTE
jgi:hypothetical protein